MTDPKPALLMPLRLEIWHNSKDEAKIRWYPDDCHIFPDKEEKFDDSLERFLDQGYELKTFPPKISLYTFKDDKIELLAEGKKIYDDKGWAEIKKISEAYPQYIKYNVKDHLLEIECGNISSDTRDEILKKTQASRDLFRKLFTEYEEKAVEKAKIKIVKREEYEFIKAKVQALNITDLKFNDKTQTIQVNRLISKKQIENIRNSNLLSSDKKEYLRKLIIKLESVSHAVCAYGILPPRIGDPGRPSAKWVTDFSIAEASGMAITIKERGKIRKLLEAEWLIATGLRDKNDNLLEDMINSQISTGRFKIIHQGEPTNNTREEKVTPIKPRETKDNNLPAHPTTAEDNGEIIPKTNAQILSKYLGVKEEIFDGMENASSLETDIVRVINYLFWPVCSVNYFEQLYGNAADSKNNSQDIFCRTQKIFTEYVTGRGHLPAVRVGENPYGFVLTAPHNDCDKSPLFETFVGFLKDNFRQKLLDLARSHGRFLDTDGVGIEELYDGFSTKNKDGNADNFHNHVLSLHKSVFSKNESDFERLENILRQNAIPARIDIEVTKNDDKEKEHIQSSDFLFIDENETKREVIIFLENLRKQLESNAFVLNLLLINNNDVEALVQSFSQAINYINKFIEQSRARKPYNGQDWNHSETTLSEIENLIVELKKLRMPKDLSALGEIANKILKAFSTLPETGKLSSQENEMLETLRVLIGIFLELKNAEDSARENDQIIQHMTENEDAFVKFIEDNTLFNDYKGLVSERFTRQKDQFNEITEKFDENIGKAKETANKIIENIQSVKGEFTASNMFKQLTPIQSAIEQININLSKLGKNQGEKTRLVNDKSEVIKQAQFIESSNDKNMIVRNFGMLKNRIAYLTKDDSQTTKAILGFEKLLSEPTIDKNEKSRQIQLISNRIIEHLITPQILELENEYSSVSGEINNNITTISNDTITSIHEKLIKLMDTIGAIEANRANLQQSATLLGDTETNEKNIWGWFSNYSETIKKLKSVLELSLAWKDSMPVLRRMLVISFIYANRGGYIGEDYRINMSKNLNVLVEWLDSENVTIQDLEDLIMEVLDCFSSRMDVWMTANTAERLNELNYDGGCNIGVYGFLEHPVAMKSDHISEYFQAPSLDQAKTVAILRAGSLNDEKAFQINLTSERINKAIWFMQGLQKGYSPAELLGRYAERQIHDNNLDIVLKPLREKFPLFIREDDGNKSYLNIIDGEKLEKEDPLALGDYLKTKGVRDEDIEPTKKNVLGKTKSLRDAVTDLSIAETVYQQVAGNTAVVQAWLESTEGKSVPPLPKVVMTPRTGYSKVQRVLVPIKAVEFFETTDGRTPQEIAEPSIANYVEGELQNYNYKDLMITIKVFRKDDPNTHITDLSAIFVWADLGISALDLVIGGKSILVDRARIKFWLLLLKNKSSFLKNDLDKDPDMFFDTYKLDFDFNVAGEKILKRASEIHGILQIVAPIEPQDLDVRVEPKDPEMESREQSYLDEKKRIYESLEKRTAQLLDKIRVLLDDLPKDDVGVQMFLLQVMDWDIPEADFPISCINNKREFDINVLNDITNKLTTIKNSLEERLQLKEDDCTNIDLVISDRINKLRSCCGSKLMTILPTFCPSSRIDAARVVDDEEIKKEFVKLKYVRKNMSAFYSFMGIANAENYQKLTFKTYRYPFKSWDDVVNEAIHNAAQSNGVPVDLTKFEIFPPVETWKTSSVDLYFFSNSDDEIEPVTNGNGSLLTGFKLDEWIDFIPKKQETTGITFNYDVPQTEAPNCFLLCAPKSDLSQLNPETLADAIANVIDLMKIRTLTTDDILADPDLQKYLPTLYYSCEYLTDFHEEQLLFKGTSENLSQNVPSTSIYFEEK